MPKPRSFDSLFHLVLMLKRKMHEQVETLNLGITPMHIRVIKIIDRKQHCTANDIAQFLNRDKAQVTRLINSLVEEQMIMRIPNPKDKRSQLLSTTDSGIDILKKMEGLEKKIFQNMCHNLSEQQLDSFQEVTETMHQNLN
ncbi:MarR family winged helix-turn-helix transcriptional regulator [Vibrio gallicus]|uniref:MarR family winged helix-turn-helix transcriptional regulator n=1 Tax=Vibrio gallicus TaxID=190897 RepID=UPI0021C48AEF|nr:MarR family transcriptional regulator [Vibrio gallicus]